MAGIVAFKPRERATLRQKVWASMKIYVYFIVLAMEVWAWTTVAVMMLLVLYLNSNYSNWPGIVRCAALWYVARRTLVYVSTRDWLPEQQSLALLRHVPACMAFVMWTAIGGFYYVTAVPSVAIIHTAALVVLFKVLQREESLYAHSGVRNVQLVLTVGSETLHVQEIAYTMNKERTKAHERHVGFYACALITGGQNENALQKVSQKIYCAT